MIKGQKGLSLGCVLQLSCFPGEGVLLCVHGSMWWWWNRQWLHPDSELEGACMVPAPSNCVGWLAKSCSAARDSMGSVVKHETPNYGASAARGVVCVGVCAAVASVSRWLQLGSLESGHTLPGQSQLLGDPPHTRVCVCVCVWNSHSWTFILVGGERNGMSPSVLFV